MKRIITGIHKSICGYNKYHFQLTYDRRKLLSIFEINVVMVE